MQNKIIIKNLSINYENTKIFTNYNLEIEGKIVCISGENGVGKSTLLNAICNMINYTGTIINPYKFSYAPASDYLYEYLSPIENIKYFKNVFEQSSRYIDKCYEILDFFDFDKKYYNYNVKELSTGNRSKLYLAIVLAMKVELYILDEPLISLDSKTQKKF